MYCKLKSEKHCQQHGFAKIGAGEHRRNFIANEAYEVTPLIQDFADAMNQVANNGFNKWELNSSQSLLGKAFAPFGLADEQIFGEFNLIYVVNDMLFWGARNVDGRGFDIETNRPTNLQIPLVRK